MIKFIVPLIISFALISCGSKDDKYQEFVEENKSTQETKDSKKEETKEQNTKEESSYKKFSEQRTTEKILISPLEANEYLGKYVTVKGFVADVHKTEKVAYLNFVEKFPNNPFTAVIFASRFEDFGDVFKYLNTDVEVTGRVSIYRNRPQIILDNESQIKIIK
ncbi:MAG: OB-fold protein [Ignavibacteria bacterium]